MDRPRRAKRWFRDVRVQGAIAGHVLRRLVPPLALVVAYTVVAAAVLRWDLARSRVKLPDFQASAYAVWTQLFFEPTDPFPGTPVSRLVFWVTPIVGVFLVAQGLLKVGGGLFDLATRRELWVTIVSEQMRGHVVVCGLGHVGYRVVEELHALGHEVVAIERNGTETFVDTVRAMGIPVHVGDARRDELLAATGVRNARAVVCATNDDLANLEIALDAKRMNPNVRVVMRMFDQRIAAKVGGALELDASFSTSAMAAPLIALQATDAGVLSAYRLGDTVRVTAEATVGAAAGGRTIGDLEAGFRVVGRKRGSELEMVTLDAKVSAGDVLVIDAAAADLARARRSLDVRAATAIAS